MLFIYLFISIKKYLLSFYFISSFKEKTKSVRRLVSLIGKLPLLRKLKTFSIPMIFMFENCGQDFFFLQNCDDI